MDEYVSARKACKTLGVSAQSLRDWAKAGTIEFIRTAGGHRRYKIDEKVKTGKKVKNGKKIIYARVSSRKQVRDLVNQKQFLRRKYPDYEVKADIGSGINTERKNFRAILELLFERNLSEVVVASADRFARIGSTNLFKWIFEYFGAKFTIVNKAESGSPAEEIYREFMELITVFTARYHGSRRYKTKKNKNEE